MTSASPAYFGSFVSEALCHPWVHARPRRARWTTRSREADEAAITSQLRSLLSQDKGDRPRRPRFAMVEYAAIVAGSGVALISATLARRGLLGRRMVNEVTDPQPSPGLRVLRTEQQPRTALARVI